MKEISVIVPIYNVEKYIESCLTSLENQEFDAYEVILMDDGSTDKSRDIAEQFVAKNPDKFKLFHQENAGQSAARNNGLKFACGKYIAYVDSDDTVESNYLKVMYEMAQKTDADLVFCAFRSVDEEGNCIKEVHENGFTSGVIYNIKEEKTLLMMENSVWNKLFKREIIQNEKLLFPDRVWAEDLRFTKKYLAHTSKCVYVDVPVYNYYLLRAFQLHTM